VKVLHSAVIVETVTSVVCISILQKLGLAFKVFVKTILDSLLFGSR